MNRLTVFKSLRSFMQLALPRHVGSQFNPEVNNNGEQRLSAMLKRSFPKAAEVSVSDISGGCGAMYEVIIDSVEFKGKNRVQQHRMVNDVLKEEIKDMHGLRILTNVPQTD